MLDSGMKKITAQSRDIFYRNFWERLKQICFTLWETHGTTSFWRNGKSSSSLVERVVSRSVMKDCSIGLCHKEWHADPPPPSEMTPPKSDWAFSHLRTCRYFSDFYFSSYGHFSVIFLKKSPQYSMITRKIRIGDFFCYFSRSIQNIAHHSQSLLDGVISEGRGGSACPSLWHSQKFWFFLFLFEKFWIYFSLFEKFWIFFFLFEKLWNDFLLIQKLFNFFLLFRKVLIFFILIRKVLNLVNSIVEATHTWMLI